MALYESNRTNIKIHRKHQQKATKKTTINRMLKTAQNSGLAHATYSFVFFGFLLVMFSVNFDVCSIAFVMHFLNGVTFQFCSST